MIIRRAENKDLDSINKLLCQVLDVHHKGRPDIFKIGTKYNEREIRELLSNDAKPILVAVNEKDEVLGYCFCVIVQHLNDSVLTDIKTLYIDDLCVDESLRGKGIGKELYHSAEKLAKQLGCYNLTLNVWECNPSAKEFYKKMGLIPQKTYMEEIIK